MRSVEIPHVAGHPNPHGWPSLLPTRRCRLWLSFDQLKSELLSRRVLSRENSCLSAIKSVAASHREVIVNAARYGDADFALRSIHEEQQIHHL